MENRSDTFPSEELLRAVRAEISGVLADEATGKEKLALHGGRRTGGHGEEQKYLFSCKSWRDHFTGIDLLVRPSVGRHPWTPCEINKTPDGKILVTTSAELGDTAQLREDETTGLRLLASRIEQATTQAGLVNPTTASWMFGRGNPRIARHADVSGLVRNYARLRLNAQQRKAIEYGLSSDVTFVWGPPGTGKTDVVAHIVEGNYRQGHRVLFLAPTNVAVDQALHRICDLLAGEQSFGLGLVLRAGDIEVPALAAAYGDRINIDQVSARLTADLDAQITALNSQLDTVREQLAVHRRAEQATDDLDVATTRMQTVVRDAEIAKHTATLAQAAADLAQEEIDRIGPASGLFAGRRTDKLNRLHNRLSEQGRTAKTHRALLVDLLSEQHRLLGRLQSLRAERDKLIGRLQEIERADRLDAKATAILDRLTELKQKRARVIDAVRAGCRVMGATVAKSVQSARRVLDDVDVVVIDEASMVSLPSAWCAAGLSAKRVVIAGDFRQLPAVTVGSGNRSATNDERAHSRQWMDRDVFHAAGLVDATGGAVTDPRMISLTTQYRMRPAICEVVNKLAYPDSPLSTGRDNTSRLPASPLLDGPLVLIDTSARRVPNINKRSTGHKSNPVHEAVIHELTRGLQYDGVLPARKWTDLADGTRPTDLMAVIAPYRDQVKPLKASLRYRFGQGYDGLVNTVHSFQGSQRPLVVIDTVAGAGQQLGQFYAGIGLDSTTCRLLNVALSRAQDHLVVVADTKFLHQKLNPSSEAATMLAELERRAHLLSVDTLIPVRAAADLAGLDTVDLARPAFFPADEVERAVGWDFAHASRSIDIYCAFLDPVPVKRWLTRLTARISQGVRVTVYTRIQEQGSTGARMAAQLAAADCAVETRDRMHEKVVIVDDTVLRHGSLNLLANTGPTDLMMRITDPESCQQVRHIVGKARMERPARPSPRSWTASPSAAINDTNPGQVRDDRLYLAVPREEKEEAKQIAQARWDRNRMLWYVNAAIDRSLVRRWLPHDPAQ